jgi:glyoxylase-like metal-dependent hydrolase (beta-lactamase superfamily II)
MKKVITLPLTISMGGKTNIIFPTLLVDESNLILVDCGYSSTVPLLEEALNKEGYSIHNLTGLVITHHDHDHMGNASAIKKINSNIKIYCHKVEVPFVSATVKPLRLLQAEKLQKFIPPEQQAYGEAFINMLRAVEPVNVDEYLLDGQQLNWCGGVIVVATPGHTPGHISLLVKQLSIVIVGDAFALENDLPIIANPQFCLDIESAKKSMDRLLAMDVKSYYCYHGGKYIKKLD